MALSDCNGHPRTNEALFAVYIGNGRSYRTISESTHNYGPLSDVFDKATFEAALPSLLNIPCAPSTVVANGKTFNALCQAGVYINSTRHEEQQVPIVTAFHLHKVAGLRVGPWAYKTPPTTSDTRRVLLGEMLVNKDSQGATRFEDFCAYHFALERQLRKAEEG